MFKGFTEDGEVAGMLKKVLLAEVGYVLQSSLGYRTGYSIVGLFYFI